MSLVKGLTSFPSPRKHSGEGSPFPNLRDILERAHLSLALGKGKKKANYPLLVDKRLEREREREFISDRLRQLSKYTA